MGEFMGEFMRTRQSRDFHVTRLIDKAKDSAYGECNRRRETAPICLCKPAGKYVEVLDE
jgi:hypothetical protein